MGKERSDKKDKKEKKEKRSESEGVKKVKKDKKDKKDKKISADLTDAVLEAIDESAATKVQAIAKVDGDADASVQVIEALPIGALVPFANPLASEKESKKSLKVVKKAAKNKTLKRGVKEVVKALRKTPSSQPSSAAVPNPPGVVIIAADISPMDVISHIPVLCEDANIPYLYVTSRAELGAAGNTKRPTSVVLIQRERQKKKGADDEAEDPEWSETYGDLVKVVQKAGASVKV